MTLQYQRVEPQHGLPAFHLAPPARTAHPLAEAYSSASGQQPLRQIPKFEHYYNPNDSILTAREIGIMDQILARRVLPFPRELMIPAPSCRNRAFLPPRECGSRTPRCVRPASRRAGERQSSSRRHPRPVIRPTPWQPPNP